MSPIVLIDGNNLGHALGYIDKTCAHYDNTGLLKCLDGLTRYLSTQHQDIETILFLDDINAAERLEGWHVHVAPVPSGDADAAIRAYARAHAEHVQILVSSDRALCGDVAVWGVVCIPTGSFITHSLVPAARKKRSRTPYSNTGTHRSAIARRTSSHARDLSPLSGSLGR